MPHVPHHGLGWGLRATHPRGCNAGLSPAPGPGVILGSSALIRLDIPGSVALPLIRSSLGGLGCALGRVGSLLGFGSRSGGVLHTPSWHPVAHAHPPHLVTSLDNLLWVFLSPPLQKMSKRGWCPQILPLSGPSSTAPSPAPPHPPPVASGPNFPTLSCVLSPAKG